MGIENQLHIGRIHSTKDLTLSGYKKDLLRELGRQGKYWFEQPYHKEHKPYKRYDDNYRKRKSALADLIRKFQFSIKNDKHEELYELVYTIFEGNTDPSFFSEAKRKILFERITQFWNDREVIYDIYEKHCDSHEDGDLFLRGIAPRLKGRRLSDIIHIYCNGFGADIYCSKESDYLKVAAEGDKNQEKNFIKTQGFTDLQYIKPKSIQRFVRIYNGIRSVKTSAVYKHETQHLINRVFMEKIDTPYEQGQDEIIAYLQNGTSKAKILQLLLDKTDIYNFFLGVDNKPINPKTYQKDHGKYFRDMLRYVDIAFMLKQKRVSNYLNLLIVTPIHDWPKLEKHFIG